MSKWVAIDKVTPKIGLKVDIFYSQYLHCTGDKNADDWKRMPNVILGSDNIFRSQDVTGYTVPMKNVLCWATIKFAGI